jgi:hypothetical protein
LFPLGKESVLVAAVKLWGASLLSAVCLWGAVAPVNAQSVARTAVLDQTLGMTLAELRETMPGLERLARPVVAPRGLRGQWRLAGTSLVGQPFDSVFYLRNQKVERIEQVRSAAVPCNEDSTFRNVVQSLGLGYGSVPNGMDAFGVTGDGLADVAAHLQTSAEACVVRVVYQPRVVKDASTL